MKWNPWLLKGSGIFFGDRASSCGAWKANVIRELQSPTHSLSSFGHLVKDSKFMASHFHCISLSQYLSVFVQLIKKKKRRRWNPMDLKFIQNYFLFWECPMYVLRFLYENVSFSKSWFDYYLKGPRGMYTGPFEAISLLLWACTHASRATQLATASGAFPQGSPKVQCNMEVLMV